MAVSDGVTNQGVQLVNWAAVAKATGAFNPLQGNTTFMLV